MSDILQRGAERLDSDLQHALNKVGPTDPPLNRALLFAADPGVKVMFDREAIEHVVRRAWCNGVVGVTDEVMELLARKWEQGDG